jgi:hypothetical protein
MTMPEASFDLNYGLILRQYDVRSSRQVTNMQTESEAELVKRLPNQQLGLSVF